MADEKPPKFNCCKLVSLSKDFLRNSPLLLKLEPKVNSFKLTRLFK